MPTDAVVGQGFSLSVDTGGSPAVTVHIGQLRTCKHSGAKVTILDVTTTESIGAYHETLAGLIDPGSYSCSGIFGPDDASQVELQTLQDARSKNTWTVALPDSRGHWTFTALVSEVAVDIDYSKETLFTMTLTVSGPVIYTPGA